MKNKKIYIKNYMYKTTIKTLNIYVIKYKYKYNVYNQQLYIYDHHIIVTLTQRIMIFFITCEIGLTITYYIIHRTSLASRDCIKGNKISKILFFFGL